jgi:predicted flap endonuclease-1-like 5' DNA nuclease
MRGVVMEAQVRKIDGFKSARGFSLSEVREVGLSVTQVRRLGIHVDSRRRTLHEFNVQTLKMLIEERKRQLEEEAAELIEVKVEKEKKKEVKKKEKKKEVKKKEVKKKEVKKEKEKEGKEIPLTAIKGVGKKKSETLEAAGISNVKDLLGADTDKLSEKSGFSPEYIEKLKEQARAV